jgi:3-hydroxyisobutyrate dehydrogenase-like beta-hydroxyacid dehydrogenase
MESIGFLGLGAMGTPMARNVFEHGFDLRVYNRAHERTIPFEQEGIPVADSPRDLAEGADAVVIMVTGGEALLDVLTSTDGVIDGLDEESVVINASTVPRETTIEASDRVNAIGASFVDAPVAGTVGPAEAGSLTVMVGGDEAVIDGVEELFEVISDTVVRCGPVCQGTSMKLANNVLLGAMMEGLSESLTLARAQGIDIGTFREVIESGGMGAPFYGAMIERIDARAFDPDYRLDLLYKDLSIALDEGGGLGVPLPASAATREVVTGARGLGHGDDHMVAVIEYFEKNTNTDR